MKQCRMGLSSHLPAMHRVMYRSIVVSGRWMDFVVTRPPAFHARSMLLILFMTFLVSSYPTFFLLRTYAGSFCNTELDFH